MTSMENEELPIRRRKKRWNGTNLKELQEAYEQNKIALPEVAAMFGTTLSNISRLGALHSWKRRRPLSTKAARTMTMLERKKARAKFVTGKLVRYERELAILLSQIQEMEKVDVPTNCQ